MGCSVTLSQEFQNHTHTRGTRDHDTAVLSVPMSHPSHTQNPMSDDFRLKL